MNRMRLVLSLLMLLCVCSLVAARDRAPAEPKVATQLENWRDADRKRTVPVKLYLPASQPSSMPVVILSHGLGGSRHGSTYLATHWAQSGFAVIAVQHPGSDESVWKGLEGRGVTNALRKAMTREQFENRTDDIHFVLDELTRKHDAGEPSFASVDLSRIAMAGHSFGALTSQAVVGQRFGRKGLLSRTYTDARLRCAIFLSPVPAIGDTENTWAFENIRVPALHLTGTLDDSPINNTLAADRRIPFAHINAADQYLLILNGGDHFIFAGSGRNRMRKGDPDLDHTFHSIIESSTTAFLRAYLCNEPESKSFLADGAFAKTLDDNATFETKLAPKPESPK
jgi:predicted dienelactone hydrolase